MKSNLTIWLINHLTRLNQDKKVSKSGHEWLTSEIRCLTNEKTSSNQSYNPFFMLWNWENLTEDKVHLTTYDLKQIINILSRLVMNLCDYESALLWNKKH